MYIRKNTPIPPFVPLPKFILRSELSLNAKLLYGLLLNRATLSQKNCWEDENGGVYVTYTVREIAEDLDRSERTSQAALSELDAAGLIQRVHQGRNRPNRIYVLLPDTPQLSAAPDPQLSAPWNRKICTPDQKDSAAPEAQNLPPNKTKEYNNLSKTEGVYLPPLGHYQNVYLTEGQRSELEKDFPGRLDAYIEKLSTYMEQSDKNYASHEAVLRRWLTEDKPAAKTKTYTDDDYEGGDCL